MGITIKDNIIMIKFCLYLFRTFPNIAMATYIAALDKTLIDCDTILDVGCGNSSPLQYLSRKQYTVGIDRYKPAIVESKRKMIHDKYEYMDIRNIKEKFKNKSFDTVIALDIIEHLKKADGELLLKQMEEIAKKKVIVMTPNGFVFQQDNENSLQTHLSGFNINDFVSKGYVVSGMYGLKILRGNHADLKKPKLIFGILSEITHYLFTYKHPQFSFSLFAVKQIN